MELPTRRPFRTYLDLLRSPGITRLFLTSNFARLPLGFQSLALVLLLREATGSYTAAGLAVSASFVVMTLTSAPMGRLVDRIGITRVVIPAAAWSAAAMAALAIAGRQGAPTPVLVALAALQGVMPPISSCQRTILSGRFAGDGRRAAFALESILQEVIWTVGPLIGTLALLVGGPPAMLVTGAVLLGAGSVLFAVSPLARSWRSAEVAHHAGGVLAQPGLRTMLMLGVLAGMSFSQFEVAVPAFAAEHQATKAAGVVLAVWAIGSAVGGILYGMRISHAPAHRRLSITALVCAVGFLPAAAAPNVWTLAPLALFAGLGIAPMLSVIYDHTGLLAPDGMMAEAFAWLGVTFPAGFALGAPIAGRLADGPGARIAIATSGIAIALAAAMVHLRRGTLGPTARGERDTANGNV